MGMCISLFGGCFWLHKIVSSCLVRLFVTLINLSFDIPHSNWSVCNVLPAQLLPSEPFLILFSHTAAVPVLFEPWLQIGDHIPYLSLTASVSFGYITLKLPLWLVTHLLFIVIFKSALGIDYAGLYMNTWMNFVLNLVKLRIITFTYGHTYQLELVHFCDSLISWLR